MLQIIYPVGDRCAAIKKRASAKEQLALILKVQERLLSLGVDYDGAVPDPKAIKLTLAIGASPSLTLVDFRNALSLVEKAAMLVSVLLDEEELRLGIGM